MFINVVILINFVGFDNLQGGSAGLFSWGMGPGLSYPSGAPQPGPSSGCAPFQPFSESVWDSGSLDGLSNPL